MFGSITLKRSGEGEGSLTPRAGLPLHCCPLAPVPCPSFKLVMRQEHRVGRTGDVRAVKMVRTSCTMVYRLVFTAVVAMAMLLDVSCADDSEGYSTGGAGMECWVDIAPNMTMRYNAHTIHSHTT